MLTARIPPLLVSPAIDRPALRFTLPLQLLMLLLPTIWLPSFILVNILALLFQCILADYLPSLL